MDYPKLSRWGYLITEEKKATPLLKSLYKAIVNYIVRSMTTLFSEECAHIERESTVLMWS